MAVLASVNLVQSSKFTSFSAGRNHQYNKLSHRCHVVIVHGPSRE
jgi:hypothetical protein